MEDARRSAEEALGLATRQGARAHPARAFHLLGEIAGHGQGPDSRRAIEAHAASLDLAEEVGMAPLEALCHLGLAAVQRGLGRIDDARRELGQAADMLRTMEMRHWLPACEALAVSIDGGVDGSAGAGGSAEAGGGTP